MLKRIILCWVFLSAPVIAGKTINFETWKTSTGTPVRFVNAPEVAVVDVVLGFYAGSARDGALPGLAQLTTDLLSQGSEGADATKIAEAFEDVAAQFNQTVDRDHVVISLRSLNDPKYLSPAVDMFTKVISKPTFLKADVERERQSQLTAITHQQQSPNTIADQMFYKTLYPNNPYGHPILGVEESVKKITIDDLKQFHKTYFAAENAILVIVGKLDVTKAKALAEQITTALPRGQLAKPINDSSAGSSAQKIVIPYPSAQTIIRIGQLAIPRLSPDYFPLIVGNYTLGGGTLTSRLAYNVREHRGLAYDVGSSFQPMMNKGPFVIALGTRQSESRQAIDVVNETLAKFIQNGPSAEELTAAKGYLVGGFPLRLESNKKIAGTLLAMSLYGLPADYLDTYIQNVQAVTSQQIQDAFKKYIQPKDMTTVLVGQESTTQLKS